MLLHEFDLKGADEEFRRAIELKPSYATAHQWYSQLLLAESKKDDALKHIEKAVELDPRSAIINMNHASYYQDTRDYTKCVELCKKVLEIHPDFVTAHLSLAGAYGKLRKLEEAREEADAALRLLGDAFPSAPRTMQFMTAYFEEDKEKLRTLLPEIEARVGEPVSLSATDIAGFHFYISESDKGFDWLERARARKDFGLLSLNYNDLFDGVRNNERFVSILRQLGLKPSPLPA